MSSPYLRQARKSHLLELSMTLYVLSLFLPAYGEHFFDNMYSPKYSFGIEVLLMGLAFGWMGGTEDIGAYAVYANIFYWFAMYRALKHDEKPIISTILTIVLSFLSFFHHEIVSDRSVSFGGYIVAWGWGAVLWFFSFGILARVVIGQYYRINLPKMRYILLTLIGIFALLIFRNNYLIGFMDDKNKEIFDSPAIAYIRTDRFKIQYIKPPQQLTSNAKIAVEGDFNDLTGVFNTPYEESIPLPERFIRNGMLWEAYNLCFDEFCKVYELQPTKQQPDYHYSVKILDNIANYQISAKNQILWQAKSQVKEYEYIPSYKEDLMNLFEKSGTQTTLQNLELLEGQKINFTQSPTCKVDKVISDHNLIQIKGHLFHTILHDLDRYGLWCAASYYLLIQPTINIQGHRGDNVAIVFDEKLRPLKLFNWLNGWTYYQPTGQNLQENEVKQPIDGQDRVQPTDENLKISQLTLEPYAVHNDNKNYDGLALVATTKIGNFYYETR